MVDNCQTYWIWWRKQMKYLTSTTQTMKQTTQTMEVMMKTTPRRKPKRIPILPTNTWEDGGYGQWWSP